jgi:hypothetical protein
MAFPIGGLVRITGLVSKPEYNGKLATVAEFSATTGRIRVSLEDGKELSLKPECLVEPGAGEPEKLDESECPDEGECPAQSWARAILEELSPQLPSRPLRNPGLVPSMVGGLEEFAQRRTAWLKAQVARPASQRLPLDASPPREVLTLIKSMTWLEPSPPSRPPFRNTLTMVRYLDSEDYRQFLGFAIQKMDPSRMGADYSSGMTRVGSLPWRKELGFWSSVNWAWLIATLIKRGDWSVDCLRMNYKLRDLPSPNELMDEISNALCDISFTQRHAAEAENFRNIAMGSEHPFHDSDVLSDLALAFDTRLWRAAAEIGLDVEDLSSTPALRFSVDDAEVVVGGVDGKRWSSQEAYIRTRLMKARADALPPAEKQRCVDFFWEAISSLRMSDPRADEGLITGLARLREHTEKQLGKSLRSTAAKYGMAVPSLLAERSTRRCSHCDAAEGTKADARGQLGAKLRHCACNPYGRPYYCDTKCQRAGWAEHKPSCTAQKDGCAKQAADSHRSTTALAEAAASRAEAELLAMLELEEAEATGAGGSNLKKSGKKNKEKRR